MSWLAKGLDSPLYLVFEWTTPLEQQDVSVVSLAQMPFVFMTLVHLYKEIALMLLSLLLDHSIVQDSSFSHAITLLHGFDFHPMIHLHTTSNIL